MVGRQLPFFSLIVPFWLIWAFAGWRGMMEVWPAILVAGVSFAIPQFLISNFINPWIVDIGASLVSMACLIGFLKIWQPKELWLSPALRTRDDSAAPCRQAGRRAGRSRRTAQVWAVAAALDHRLRRPADLGHRLVQGVRQSDLHLELSGRGLHNLISKVPPVVAKPTPEGAVFAFTCLSFTGSGMLIAAIICRLRRWASRPAHWSRPTARRSGCCATR